jgi:hypothetical protein
VPELSNIPGSAYELEHVHKHAKFGKKKPLKGSCFKLLGEEVDLSVDLLCLKLLANNVAVNINMFSMFMKGRI